MKFKFKDKEYRIRWKYDNSENPPFGRQNTTCMIEEVSTLADGESTKTVFNTLAEATVGRFHKDKFSYEAARKASLKKVLNKTFVNLPERPFFSREFRTAAWEVYNERKPETMMVKMEVVTITEKDLENIPDFLKEGENGFAVGDKYLKPIQ